MSVEHQRWGFGTGFKLPLGFWIMRSLSFFTFAAFRLLGINSKVGVEGLE